MTALLQAGLVLLLQTTALLLLGLFALRLTRPRGPAVQTLVGRAALSGTALLLLLAPLSSRITLVWRIPTPVRPSPALPKREGAEVQPVGALRNAPPALPMSPEPPSAAAFPRPTAPAAPGPAVPAGATSGAPTSAALPTPRPPVSGGPLRSKEVGILLPSFALLVWLAVCQWHLVRLRRTAQAVTDGPAVLLLASLTPNPPPLLTHPAVSSPFLAGLRRPAIFLPLTYAADFDADALRAVFTHELAHRDRRDNFWTLAAHLLTAALWFQPLLWLLCRRLEQISEDACDEAVLASNCTPRAYAACLLSLAERPPLTRRQRVLAAGVVPLRSSLSRRITRILTAQEPRAGITRGFRVAVSLCFLVVVPGVFLLLNTGPSIERPHFEVPHFVWAKQQGWEVRPVRVINLDQPGPTAIAGLPYDITEQDKAAIGRLSSRETADYGTPGPPASARVHFEAMLAAQPHFFYAEYLLASWYRQHGDAAHAAALRTQSLRDAPVVLAGRYEYDDGTPVAGVQLSTTILCYSPARLAAANDTAFQKIAVRLDYPDIVTDTDGCYYIPMFRAVYSQQSTGWHDDQLNALTAARLNAHAALITPGPATSGTNSDEHGERLDKGFVAESRVAVLPQTEVRPRIALSVPFNAAEGSVVKPLLLTGSRLTVSWPPYPNAFGYKVLIDEHHPSRDKQGKPTQDSDEWQEISASSQNPSRLGLPIPQTSISVDFMGSDPIFNRTYPYTFTVVALDRDGETIISQSDQYTFEPLNALAPQPLTKTALAQALGPGFVVQSLETQKDRVIAVVLTPANLNWTLAMSNRIESSGRQFGLSSYAGWSSSPGMEMNTVNAAQTMLITYNRGNN